MNEGRYNIAIMVPGDLEERAIRTSAKFAPAGALFTLDAARSIPHVSLYHVSFPTGSVSEVVAELGNLFQAVHPFGLRARECRYSRQGGWVNIAYASDTSVVGLHESVIRRVGGFRSRDSERASLSDGREFSSEERENLDRCGWVSSYGRYDPHLTITRLAEDATTDVGCVRAEEFSFTAGKVGFFAMGEHGTCRDLVAEFVFAAKRNHELF